MTRQRTDEYVLEIEDQSDLTTEGSGTPLVMPIVSVDLSSIRRSEVEDPSYTVDGGMHASIPGVWHSEIGVSLSAKAEGLRTAPAVGSAPDKTAQVHLMESVMQQDADLTTRDVAGGSPTTTSVPEGTAGRHDITAVGSLTAVGLTGFEVGSSWEVRPYTTDGSTLTLLGATSAALSADDGILAQAQAQYTDGAWSALPEPKTMRFLGNDNTQHRKVIGAASSLSIGEVGPDEVQQVEYSIQGAYGARAFSDTRPAATVPRGVVQAGGQLLIGAYGNSAMSEVCGRISATIRPDGYMAAPCPNGSYGLSDWLASKAAGELRLTLPHDFVPSDLAGASSSTWWDAWIDGELYYHVLYVVGSTPGYMHGWYWPHQTIMRPDDADIDEHDARTLIMRHTSGSSYPAVVESFM